MEVNNFILKCNGLKKNVELTIDELRVLLSPQPHGINRVYELIRDLKNILEPQNTLSENEKELLNDLKRLYDDDAINFLTSNFHDLNDLRGLYDDDANPHYRHNMILKLIDMQQEFYCGIIPERKKKESFRAGISNRIITNLNIIYSPLHDQWKPIGMEVSIPGFAQLVAKSYMDLPSWKRYFNDEWAYTFSKDEYFCMINSFYESLSNFLNFFDIKKIENDKKSVTYDYQNCFEEILRKTSKCMFNSCYYDPILSTKVKEKVNVLREFDRKKFLEIFEDHTKNHGLFLKNVDRLDYKDLKLLYHSLGFPNVMYIPFFVDKNEKSEEDIDIFIQSDFFKNLRSLFCKGRNKNLFFPHLFICVFETSPTPTELKKKIYGELLNNEIMYDCSVLYLQV